MEATRLIPCHKAFLVAGLFALLSGSACVQAETNRDLALNLTIREATVPAGFPLTAEISLLPHTDQTLTVDLGLNRDANIKGVVTHPDGSKTELKYLHRLKTIRRPVIQLQGGSVYVLQVILDRLETFGTVGDYTISLNASVSDTSGVALASATRSFQVRVVSATQTELRRRCQNLLDQINETSQFEKQQLLAEELSAVASDVADEYKEQAAITQPILAPMMIDDLRKEGTASSTTALVKLSSETSINRNMKRLTRDALQSLLISNTVPARESDIRVAIRSLSTD